MKTSTEELGNNTVRKALTLTRGEVRRMIAQELFDRGLLPGDFEGSIAMSPLDEVFAEWPTDASPMNWGKYPAVQYTWDEEITPPKESA